MLLHIGLYVAMPYLQTTSAKPFKRIEVELNTVMKPQQETPQPAPKPHPAEAKPESSPQQVKKQPVQQKPVLDQPVLASKSAGAPDDYVAATVAEPVQAIPEAAVESQPEVSQSANASAKSPDNALSEQASTEEAWDGYGKALYEMVGKNKNYPQMAIRRNWEGQAKVLAKFILGKLVDVTLIDSSGHEVLDKEAMSMLRKAVNQLPVKGGLANKTFTITVPVDFKLSEQ